MVKKVFNLLPLRVQNQVRHQRANGPFPSRLFRRRYAIAAEYLTGNGLEIGALHAPLRVPKGTKVRYVDRLPVDELRKHYPELCGFPLVNVDILGNGEALVTVADASVDFLVANHVIEHTEDPISTLQAWLRVLRPRGVLFIAVPNKLHTFASERPLTTLEHLVHDYDEGPEWSRRDHYEEWARLVEKAPEGEIKAHAKQLLETNYSIHYHVWTEVEFLEFLSYCRDNLGLPFSVEVLEKKV